MAALHTIASVLAVGYPVHTTWGFELMISVTDPGGQPLVGLKESDIQIRVVGRGEQVVAPWIAFTKSVPVLDEHGNPVTEIDPLLPEGQQEVPVTTLIPGDARSLGLPGYYRMMILGPAATAGKWPVGHVAIQVAVRHGDDFGQTIVPMDVLV